MIPSGHFLRGYGPVVRGAAGQVSVIHLRLRDFVAKRPRRRVGLPGTGSSFACIRALNLYIPLHLHATDFPQGTANETCELTGQAESKRVSLRLYFKIMSTT